MMAWSIGTATVHQHHLNALLTLATGLHNVVDIVDVEVEEHTPYKDLHCILDDKDHQAVDPHP